MEIVVFVPLVVVVVDEVLVVRIREPLSDEGFERPHLQQQSFDCYLSTKTFLLRRLLRRRS
jgi:hypothetical protein